MTTLAMIFGMAPLAFALTEGSEQIRDLEDQIQPLQEQYAALQPAGDGENGDMSAAVPTCNRRNPRAETCSSPCRM